MKSLGQPNSAWAGDQGLADEQVRAVLAAAAGSPAADDYLAAVAVLCGARLLVPIVADGDESGDGPDPDRHAELAAVLMTSASGASGALAFTGLDALQSFDPKARPVPCTLDDVASTALQAGAAAVVVDVAGPHLLVIEGDLVNQLASGRRLVRVEDGWGWLSVAAAD